MRARTISSEFSENLVVRLFFLHWLVVFWVDRFFFLCLFFFRRVRARTISSEFTDNLVVRLFSSLIGCFLGRSVFFSLVVFL